MTVQQLIDKLSNYDPETPVHFAYNYGDHGKTMVAAKVRNIDDGAVVYSEYHKMHRLADEDEYNDADEPVVVLS